MAAKLSALPRKLFSDCTFFYGVSELSWGTIRFGIELIDPVDGDILKQAVEKTLVRYPYLLMKREDCFDGIRLQPNDNPVAVLHKKEPVALGGAESNGHLLAYSFWENTIVLNIFHGICDGQVALCMTRTLLWYYCTLRYDVELSREGIWFDPAEISPAEYEDPYKQEFDPQAEPLIVPKSAKKVLNLFDDPRIMTSESYVYRLEIAENEFIHFCRTNDGSPAVTVSLLLARAIAKLNPQRTADIQLGLAQNRRAAMGTPLTHYSFIGTIPVVYDDKMAEKTFDTQNSVWRGRVFLANDPETVLPAQRDLAQFFKAFNAIPLRTAKQRVMTKLMQDYIHASTFAVSYAGKAYLGDTERYVRAMELDPDFRGTGIMVEMSAANGMFFLDFRQDWEEDLYFEAFCDEMRGLGIAYNVRCKEPFLTPLYE